MTLYGFFYNSCIYESAAGLQSLHFTKAGAWRALRKHRYASEVEDRENCPFKPKGWTKAGPSSSWKSWFIQTIEVQE